MSITLRVILLIGSVISFILCVRRIKQAKRKVENSIIWMVGSFVLILMSIFSSGLSAGFGDVIVKKETETLKKTYQEFELGYLSLKQ